MMQGERSHNAAYGGWSHAKAFNGGMRCGLQMRMVGKPQIIIGAQVEHALPIHHNPGTLGACHAARLDQEAFLLQCREFGLEEIPLAHCSSFCPCSGSNNTLPHSPCIIRCIAWSNSCSGKRWVSIGDGSSSPAFK